MPKVNGSVTGYSKLANGKGKFATNETLKLKYPVSVSQKGLLDSPRKCQFLKNVPV